MIIRIGQQTLRIHPTRENTMIVRRGGEGQHFAVVQLAVERISGTRSVVVRTVRCGKRTVRCRCLNRYRTFVRLEGRAHGDVVQKIVGITRILGGFDCGGFARPACEAVARIRHGGDGQLGQIMHGGSRGIFYCRVGIRLRYYHVSVCAVGDGDGVVHIVRYELCIVSLCCGLGEDRGFFHFGAACGLCVPAEERAAEFIRVGGYRLGGIVSPHYAAQIRIVRTIRFPRTAIGGTVEGKIGRIRTNKSSTRSISRELRLHTSVPYRNS